MATKTKKAAKPEAAPKQEVIVSYKGFGQDWKCRTDSCPDGFLYEVGKTYEHSGEVQACKSGFHACEYPLHVLRYYRPGTSRFAVVEQSGTLARHDEDSKIASSRLTVKAELNLPGLIKAAIQYTMDRCTPAKGAQTDADKTSVCTSGAKKSATASGYSGAATASGRNGKAKGKTGCALFLVYRDEDRKIVHAKAAVVGQDGIKEDTFYRLDSSGAFVEAN